VELTYIYGAWLQELTSHLLLRDSTATAGKRSKPGVAEPAQDMAWLPGSVVAMGCSVAGYPWQAPINAGDPKQQLAQLLGAPAAPAIQTVAAHMYRVLRRAFLLWPRGQQQDSLSAMVDLWLAFCFPWRTRSGKCAAFKSCTPAGSYLSVVQYLSLEISNFRCRVKAVKTGRGKKAPAGSPPNAMGVRSRSMYFSMACEAHGLQVLSGVA
jgi:hypothetical protein